MTNDDTPLTVEQYAQQLWDSFGEEKRNLIRIGMLPAGDMHSKASLEYDAKEFAVALMNCAKKDGGMLV